MDAISLQYNLFLIRAIQHLKRLSSFPSVVVMGWSALHIDAVRLSGMRGHEDFPNTAATDMQM